MYTIDFTEYSLCSVRYKLLHSAFNCSPSPLLGFQAVIYVTIGLQIISHLEWTLPTTIAGPCETGYDALKHVIQSISHIMAHRVPFNPTSYHFLPPIVLVIRLLVTHTLSPNCHKKVKHYDNCLKNYRVETFKS
jgi:hypothetical protein